MSVVAVAAGAGALLSYSASQDANDTAQSGIEAQRGMADTQAKLGQEQLALSREQWQYGKDRQAKLDPLYEQMMTSALADSDTARSRGADQWQQYVDIFRPAENKLASTAMNYDTAGRRDQVAGEAVAGVQQQFDKAKAQQQRGLSRAGISLDSGRALSLSQDADFAQAKASAGADRTARKQIEDMGIQMVDNAARFGRNQTGTALQSSGQGSSGTQSAAGIGATGAGVSNSLMQPAVGLMNSAWSTLSSAGSMYGQSANLAAGQAAAANQGIGQLGSLAGYAIKSGGIGGVSGGSSGLSNADLWQQINGG